jgi:hypothetical protein
VESNWSSGLCYEWKVIWAWSAVGYQWCEKLVKIYWCIIYTDNSFYKMCVDPELQLLSTSPVGLCDEWRVMWAWSAKVYWPWWVESNVSMISWGLLTMQFQLHYRLSYF